MNHPHEIEHDIWTSLKDGQRTDWTRWIDRTVGGAIGAVIGAMGLWSFFL